VCIDYCYVAQFVLLDFIIFTYFTHIAASIEYLISTCSYYGACLASNLTEKLASLAGFNTIY